MSGNKFTYCNSDLPVVQRYWKNLMTTLQADPGARVSAPRWPLCKRCYMIYVLTLITHDLYVYDFSGRRITTMETPENAPLWIDERLTVTRVPPAWACMN